MSSSALDTLLIPFIQDETLLGGDVLFMGAVPHPILRRHPVSVWQVFKPDADGLAAQGLTPLQTLADDKAYDKILILAPKQVDEARYWLAYALTHLKDDHSRVYVCAANDANGNRLSKWLAEAGCATETLSKNKAKLVIAGPAKDEETLLLWRVNGMKINGEFGDGIEFLTQAGLFSWDRIDPASRVLAACLNGRLQGAVADFGCGYGYLSYMALTGNASITDLTLIDADYRAVDVALQNMPKTDCGIHPVWHDLTKPVPCLSPQDYIIMNPPFHRGKTGDPDIGIAFIKTAHGHLKPGGTLYMVANVHLPYEATLKSLFQTVEQITVENGFKVLKGVRK